MHEIKLYTKICEHCKLKFTTDKYKRRYCSYDCVIAQRLIINKEKIKQKGYLHKPSKKIIKICKNCNLEFIIKKESKDKPRKYCSRKCSAIDGASIVSEKQKLNWKKEKESGVKRKPVRPKRLLDLVCEYCKSEFTVPYKSRHRKFCSHECYSSSRSFDRIVKCEYCGNDFTEKSYKQKYCSMSCSGKAIGEKQTGENAPFYGRTHTEENKKLFSEKATQYIAQHGAPFLGKKHSIDSRLAMSLTKHNLSVEDIVDIDSYLKEHIEAKVCPICSVDFNPTKRIQICCGKDCDAKRRDFLNRKPKVCRWCAKEFYSNKNDQKCCSYHCYMKKRMSDPAEVEKIRQFMKGRPSLNKGLKMSAEWCEKHRQRVVAHYATEDGQKTKELISEALKKFYKTDIGKQLRIIINSKLSKLFLGELNPFYGKIHSKEVIKILSEKALGRPSAFKGKTHSDETKAAASIRMILYCIEHGNTADKFSKKGTYFSEKNKTTIKYDSSYELTAFEKLEHDDKVISYEKCNFYIPYKLDIQRNYLPDIIVVFKDSPTTVIEIKPKYKLIHEKPEYKAKFLAALTYCKLKNWKFRVWTEFHIFPDDDKRYKQAVQKVKPKNYLAFI